MGEFCTFLVEDLHLRDSNVKKRIANYFQYKNFQKLLVAGTLPEEAPPSLLHMQKCSS